MPVIVRRPKAVQDLAKIWNRIALESNEERAISLLLIIDHAMSILAEHPNIGRNRPDIQQNIRSFPVGNYVILYMPIQDGIRVVRVLHAAMDLSAHLKGVQ